jgi:hypothetical protein
MIRGLYRCLVRLHPVTFRLRFEEEMLWIFDQAAGSWGATALIADAALSLSRQWCLRSGLWIWFVATIAGTLPLIIAFGSLLHWDKPICH